MSVMSLLMTRSCADLRSAWQSSDFEQLGISFVRDNSPRATTGLLIFEGVAFTYDIQQVPEFRAEKFIFCNADTNDMQSAIQFDFGPAVPGGGRVPAIVKVLMRLGEVLGELFEAKAVFWWPASILSGFAYYTEAVNQYAEDAAFPALVCVGYDTSKTDLVQTNGLAWLCGQELAFEHAPVTLHTAMRYVVRLVHDLATQGCINHVTEVQGMMAGEVVFLTPDPDNNVLIARLLPAA